MDKKIHLLLVCMFIFSAVKTIGSQVSIEEKQPSFAEALRFFKQKSVGGTTKSAQEERKKIVTPTKVLVEQEKIAELDNNSWKAQVKELQNQNALLVQRVEDVSEKLDQEQQKVVELRNQIAELDGQDIAADSLISEQLSQATQETAEMQKQIIQLEKQVENLTQALSQNNQALQKKDNLIAVLEEKVAQVKSAGSDFSDSKVSAIPMAASVKPVDKVSEVESSDSALQKHLEAIRAGVELKSINAVQKKKKEEKTGLFGAIAAGLQKRFGWMTGAEEPEDEWDNEVEDFIQTP